MADMPPLYVIDNFNDANSVNSWFVWYNNVPVTFSYDATHNFGGNPGSGSLKISADFSGNTFSPQFILARCLSGNPWDMSVSVPSSLYQYLSFDLLWDPGSTLDGDGTFGSMFIRPMDPGYQSLFPETMVTTPAGATGWIHAVVPITSDDPTAEVSGLWLRMWEGNLSGGQLSTKGPVTFWVDNLQMWTVVPEPSSFTLLFWGGFSLTVLRGRRVRSRDSRPASSGG
jgi:hypothetical protein